MACVKTRRGNVDGRLYHVNMPKEHFYGDQIQIQTETLGVFVPDTDVYQGVRIPHYSLPVTRNGKQMMLVCNKPVTFYPPARFTQRIPDELKETARQAKKEGLILQDWVTPDDWALVRPGPGLSRLKTYSTSRLFPLDDIRQRSDSWTMNRDTDHPLNYFGKQQQFETGTLEDLRNRNHRGNPPAVSDVESRTSQWSLSHDSPLPTGTLDQERFEERDGRPGFWHEIFLPVDRSRFAATHKTIENIVRSFPQQTAVIRFEPPTREVWLPWREQYEPFDFTMPRESIVNQYFLMDPIPECDRMPGQENSTNTAVYPGHLGANRQFRFFPRPLVYNGRRQHIPRDIEQWARRDNCRRCVPMSHGAIRLGCQPKIREPHTVEGLAEIKSRKCKVQPSLFKKIVKARHQNDLRAQYVDTLGTDSGRMPQRAITPPVKRPAAAPLQWETPIQVHQGASNEPVPSTSSGTSQFYVPLPPDDELPVDEDDYWAPWKEDYEAPSEMTQWDTDQRAIEIAQMDEGASGGQTLATPRTASQSSAGSRTLAQRWADLKRTVTSGLRRMHLPNVHLPNMLPSCCRRRGCTASTGAGCLCGHHEEGEATSMSTFHVPVDDAAFRRNLRPCCIALGCSRESACSCHPSCF